MSKRREARATGATGAQPGAIKARMGAGGDTVEGVAPRGVSRESLERWAKGRGEFEGQGKGVPVEHEESTLVYLLRIFIVYVVGPVLGRIGRMDDALGWLRRSGLDWAEAYAMRVGVGRTIRNRDLGRDPSWSYTQEEDQEGAQEGLSAKRAYQVRATLLKFFSAHATESYSAAEVGRRFRRTLPFVPLKEYDELLRLYVSKQWLVSDGDRYRIRSSYTPLNLEQRQTRAARLERRLETFAPLCQSYLDGQGYMLSIDAELPLELWHQLESEVREFVRQRMPILMDESNRERWKDMPEFTGGAIFLLGPYPWLAPGWDEGYAEARQRLNPKTPKTKE